MKIRLLFSFLLYSLNATSQIGIGETSPTAALEIKTTFTGLSALRLNPQAAPVGTDTGQIAVIGDQLFMYDAAQDRQKWLSVEQTTLEYGRLGNSSDSEEVEFGGDVQGSGPKMPFKGTIVGVALQATQDDRVSDITLQINGNPVPNDISNPNKDGVFNLDPSTRGYTNMAYSINFEAGDFFTFIVDGTTDIIENLTIVLYVKWRRDNS